MISLAIKQAQGNAAIRPPRPPPFFSRCIRIQLESRTQPVEEIDSFFYDRAAANALQTKDTLLSSFFLFPSMRTGKSNERLLLLCTLKVDTDGRV